MKKRIYSYEVGERVKEQIPQPILDAMTRLGWNAFGIYEVVERELKEEKKRQKNGNIPKE
jgi:hypothetical protein